MARSDAEQLSVSIVGEILHVGSRNWTAGSNHGRATNYVEFAFGSDRRWLPGGIWVCVGDRCQSGWSYSRAGNHRQLTPLMIRPLRRWLKGAINNRPLIGTVPGLADRWRSTPVAVEHVVLHGSIHPPASQEAPELWLETDLHGAATVAVTPAEATRARPCLAEIGQCAVERHGVLDMIPPDEPSIGAKRETGGHILNPGPVDHRATPYAH